MGRTFLCGAGNCVLPKAKGAPALLHQGRGIVLRHWRWCPAGVADRGYNGEIPSAPEIGQTISGKSFRA